VSEPAGGEEARRTFRWQGLFQSAAEAMFVLDRRRRLLFVNAAFESLTGLALDEVRGQLCRRPRSPGGDALPEDAVAYLLTPPPEVLDGTFARVRKLFTDRRRASGPPAWWDVEFLPFRQEEGNFVLGRVVPAPAAAGEAEVLLPERLVSLRRRAAGRYGFELLQSGSPAVERLARQVRLALQVREPVLLLGERGAGKQTVARVIHHQGRDAESAFAALDCERLPADALATLLTGASPALAGVGTVYLRQVCALPRELQSLLCQRLTSGYEGPRVLSGLTAPIEESVRDGRLLRELACLLSPLTLDVPPLRQRLDDLPRLAERMLARLGEGTVALTPAAYEVLRGHAWPGNLAELFAVLADSRPRATQGRIDVADLPAALRLSDRLGREAPRQAPQPPLPELLEQVERRLIEVALRRARGNRSKAADALGIYRSLLVRRMKALGLEDAEEQ
jgi:PAS domain S-box-containing protein